MKDFHVWGDGSKTIWGSKRKSWQDIHKIDINGDGDLTENKFIKGCSDNKLFASLTNLMYATGDNKYVKQRIIYQYIKLQILSETIY